MGNSPEVAKPFTLFFSVRVFVQQIHLAGHKLSEHQHAGSRVVDVCPLDEKLISSPCVVDPDCRSPVLCYSLFMTTELLSN